MRRRINVDCIDVDATLFKRHVPAGQLNLLTRNIYTHKQAIFLYKYFHLDCVKKALWVCICHTYEYVTYVLRCVQLYWYVTHDIINVLSSRTTVRICNTWQC